MRAKAEMVEELKSMLRDLFAARSEGANYPRLARAHGYVDGYMRALLESGMASKQELLELVARERVRVDGPATEEVSADEAAA